jgi:hypothetical protein
VLLWLVITAGTVQQSISGKAFFAPCLGTDLYLKKLKERILAVKVPKKEDV